MECPNCHFENMPGNVACMQCGTSLTLATAAMAICPPRASPLAKRLRTWFPAMRFYYGLQNRIAGFGLRLPPWLSDALVVAPLRRGTWPRMLVPGWAHAHEGQFNRGRWFLLAWLTLAALCALTFGSTISALLAGLLLAVHTGAMVDLAWRSRPVDDPRTLYASGVLRTVAACAVALALYAPLEWAVVSVIDARQWMMDEAPFAEGDVVLFRPLSNAESMPQLGEVVLYTRDSLSIQQGNHRTLQRPAGAGIDRLIAGPESVVRWRRGELFVNEKPSTFRPLNADRLPGDLEIRVPRGYVCIFPSTDGLLTTSGSLDLWMQQSLVRQDAILGRALVRNYPVWRFWWIQ